jgi:hypothetical protein
MEDALLWQVCDQEVHHDASILQPHMGIMFGSVSATCHTSHASSISHFAECCLAPPPPPPTLPPPPPAQLPFASQWGLQYESCISKRGVDELHDMITLRPSTSSAGGGGDDDTTVVAVDRALILQGTPLPQAAPGGVIINFGCNLDGQQQADVGGINTRASRGHHGFYSNQAMSIAGHSAQLDSCTESALVGPDMQGSTMLWPKENPIIRQDKLSSSMNTPMIDGYYLQTLNSALSPSFNYNTVLQGTHAEESIMEASLGSVVFGHKVWNSRTDPPFGMAADHSLITNPMGSLFHSISAGSSLMQYLQNRCEAAQGSSLMYQLQQNKCEAQGSSLMHQLQNKCEAQVTLKLPQASQVSGTEEAGGSSPGACSIVEELFLQRQTPGSNLVLASSLPSPLLMKKKKKNIGSAAAAAATLELVQNINTTVTNVAQKQDRNNVISVVHGALCPYLSSSATIAAESHDNTMKALSGGGHTWLINGSEETLSSDTSSNTAISNSTKMVFSEEAEQFDTHFQIRKDAIVEPSTVTKWSPNVVAVASPLEEKCALPPPLAVMKCALPRHNNNSGRWVAAASNTTKRPLWPANEDNNISGFLHKKPIAKWPVAAVEGCSRLEAVSSLAHHTVATQNKTSNARTLGPALNTNLKPRARQGSANDPQSIAARVRRERISDRLKALQLLIPNGDKVDMVTMLEKAINYVHCLELQIRMLKDDALWPKALGVLPNTLQELLELAGPEFAALREEEDQNKKKEKSKHINKEDPLSSPAPSSNNTE